MCRSLAMVVVLGVLGVAVPPNPCEARVPKGRTLVQEADLQAEKGGPPIAALLEGMPVHILDQKGPKLRVRTRGPVRIEGLIPKRAVGLCVDDRAPARLSAEADPVGYVPKGWCFRVLTEMDEHVRAADPTFGLTVLVEHKNLTDQVDWKRRWNPTMAGLVKYRIQPQEMRQKPNGNAYFTVPQGEWPMRAVHEEGDQALVEILGSFVVLQGWERTTNLYQDLFRNKDEVERARALLLEKSQPRLDPRTWFTTRRKAPLFVGPGRDEAGEIAPDVEVTVNRRTGKWAQIRIEPKGRRGVDAHRMQAKLWIEQKVLFELGGKSR